MPTFLVEVYLAPSEPRNAAPVALRRGGSDVRYRWSLLLPDEEIGFHVVDGPSLDAVRKLAARVRVRCQRITEAVLISADDLDFKGGSR
jgi:hypothetical protein